MELVADNLGNIPLYHSSTPRGALASNSIRLIALALKELGLPVKLSLESIATTWFTNHVFGSTQVSKETYVEGVEMCLIGQRVRFDARGMSVTDAVLPETEPLGPGEYRHLLDKGIQEIRESHIGLFNTDRTIVSTLTGGRDSRMMLAALLSLGRESDVYFRTTPNDDDDVRISTGLANYFGLSYAPGDGAVKAEHRSYDEDLRRHSMMHMGAKSLFVPMATSHSAMDGTLSLTLVGAGGELYRSLHTKRFGPDILDKPVNPETVEDWLRGYGSWQNLTDEIREITVASAHASLKEFNPQSIGDALDMHYANYRNRHHFGATAQYNRDRSSVNMHPLMSPALFRLSRRIARPAMMSDRMVFDITRTLNFDLAHLPFDKPLSLPSKAGMKRAKAVRDELIARFRPDPELLKSHKPGPVHHEGQRERRSRHEFVMAAIDDRLNRLYDDPVAGRVLTDRFIRSLRVSMPKMKANHLSTLLGKLDAACEVIELGC